MEQDGWSTHPDGGFLSHVGPILERWENGAPVLGFQASDIHRNSRDVVQGGMLMTLADRAMGYTLRSSLPDTSVATIQLDVHFLDAASIDEFVEARATILRVTTYVAFLESRLTCGERLIATGRGMWKILRPVATTLRGHPS